MISIIGSFVLLLSNYYLFLIINDEKEKRKKDIAKLLIGSLLIYANYQHVEGPLRLVIAFFILVIIFKNIFDLTIYKSTIQTLFYYILVAISEVIFVLIVLLLFRITPENLVNSIIGSFISNLSISAILFLLITSLKQKIVKLNHFLKEKEEKIFLYFSILIIIVLGNIFFKNYYNDFKIDMNLFVNFIIIILICILVLNLILEKSKIIKINKDFKITEQYLKTIEKVIGKYQKERHEYHNNLTILQSLPTNKRQKFIQELIKEDELKELGWISNLKKLPSGGIKGTVFYKLINEETIKKEIVVEKNIKKLRLNDKDNFAVSKIIAILLDNAITAAKNTKDKVIIIEYYNNKNEHIISFQNSSNQKFLLEENYSTKKNHKGLGLKIIKEIIKNNERVKLETIIEKNMVIQNIKIKE